MPMWQTRAALAQVGPDEVSDAFAAALQQFVRADGSVHLDNVFRLVFARA